MERFNSAIAVFQHAVERARQMVSLYDALVALRPREPANDDALRSAYFQVVSSFDFFAHEIAAIEANYRLSKNIRTKKISVPMELMVIVNEEERIAAADSYLRQQNSYRAFVDPGKLAELLSCYCDEPWKKIHISFNDGKNESDKLGLEELKGQLKNIWRRRNQIAHEADVNPTFAGIGLWPIDKTDTQFTIDFIVELGRFLPMVISTEFDA
ncbi:HEPN domain-containing protein [Pseudomonas sp. RIT-PI-S]|uniref:HEPN domain-containing protein n=1 Tax=Pseudomonas sp. RIT-PI-S TaxID=3035295 RepID=UPI0021D8647C|nr:HEPN domain-containing protein [Pseudomonas sp. RIT-PI-S]